jgi:hypothetical protein
MAERKFGSRTFRCEPLNASQGLALFGRVAKAAGPFFSVFAAMAAEDGSAAMKSAMDEAFGSIAEPAFQATVIDLAELCTVNGEPVIADANVSDLGELVEVAFWAVEVQFGPFLRGGALKRVGDRFIQTMGMGS